MVLPLQAIINVDEKTFVYIIENNQLQKREVLIGFIGNKTVEVISGIEVDDQIVLSPMEVEE